VLRINSKAFRREAIQAFVARAKPWGLTSASSRRLQACRLQYLPRFARQPRLKRDVRFPIKERWMPGETWTDSEKKIFGSY
jgi:hypothetical protein